jgi:septal ring factor EnvC (AmiA/AmiB activator)
MAQDPLSRTGPHGLLNGFSDSSGSQRLDDLTLVREMIPALSNTINSRDQQINNRLADIVTKMNKLEGDIGELKNSHGNIKTDLATLSTRHENIPAQIAGLQNSFENFKRELLEQERRNSHTMKSHIIGLIITVLAAIVVAFILSGLKLKS